VTFSSDALAPLERRIIEEDLGVPVFGVYSSTEAFAMAFECEIRDGYHVHEDVSHVRIADSQGRSVDRGVPGSIIVSNLVNRGTVLLNYRQGDLGEAIEGPCPCGRPLPRIRLLAGRDMLFIERAEGHPVHQFKLFRALQDVGLYRWQVIQTALQRFTVRVISLPGQERLPLEARIREVMTGLIGGGLEITIEYPSELERTPTGKVLAFFRRPSVP
jgi:phenylacetate-CoA ligase